MAIKFNPLTGNFDFTGSGGGGGSAFFAGEVATYADLPLDGTAALNSRWLVRSSSGTWPFPNYRQGGIYIRTSSVGSSRDNDYTLADTKLPDVFADSAFLLYDNSDSTRNLQFDLGSITTGTTRTLTVPDASGTIALTSDIPAAFNPAAPGAIGGTTAAAGTFTTLTASTSLALTGGIITGASNVIEQVNGTSSQEMRWYRTSSSSNANYERGYIGWGGSNNNHLIIGTDNAGTGSARNIELYSASNLLVRFQLEGAILSQWQALNLGTSRISGYDYSRNRTALLLHPASDLIIDTGLLSFHGSTSSFPALKRDSATLQVRLADDSAFAGFSCGALTLNGNLDASTRDIVTDTTTGTKIGTGTTQKIGFFNATPVVQQAAVADATDAASTQARLNDLLARLRTLGLIAT
jgi:hypothetical protein